MGIKTKLNARLPIRQRIDLFEGNVSANKISLPQGQNCTLSITLLYNYLPVYHTIYCSHFSLSLETFRFEDENEYEYEI